MGEGSMSNPWFRLHAEFLSDPKVQMLSEQDQRRFIMLLCMRCMSNKRDDLRDDAVTFALRVTAEQWRVTKEALRDRNLIDENNFPTNWEKRQYISDLKDATAAARAKRYRDRKRDDRDASRVTPVTSRLPDTDTDTDTEHSDTKKARVTRVVSVNQFDEFWSAWPNKVGKPAAQKSYAKVAAEHDAIMFGLSNYIANKPPDRPWLNPATFLNQRRWEDAPAHVEPRAHPAKQKISAITEAILFLDDDHGQQETDSISDSSPVQQIPRLICVGS